MNLSGLIPLKVSSHYYSQKYWPNLTHNMNSSKFPVSPKHSPSWKLSLTHPTDPMGRNRRSQMPTGE